MTQGSVRIRRGWLLAALGAVVFLNSAQAATVTLPTPVPLRPESMDKLRKAAAGGDDHWKVVAFGFTRCKDVCPMTFGTLSHLLKVAAEEEIPLEGVFVTIDPDRDTELVLSRYTAPYGDRISYLRLEGDVLDRFKDEFGAEAVFYTKNHGNEVHYQVDHSSMAFLIDPAGRIRVLFDALKDGDSVAKMLREEPGLFE